MHSSANSVQSMDSIRTELSRLEAMITRSQGVSDPALSNQKAQYMPDELGRSSMDEMAALQKVDPDSDDTLSTERMTPDKQAQAGHRLDSAKRSNSSERNLDEHKMSSEIAESGVPESKFLYAQLSHDLQSSSRLRRREDSNEAMNIDQVSIDGAHSRQFAVSSHQSSNDPGLSKAPHGERERTTTNPKFFPPQYSQASVSAEGKRHSKNVGGDFKDHRPQKRHIKFGAIHRTLRHATANVYPCMVADYVSLQQLATLCEGHLKIISQMPSVKSRTVTKEDDHRDKTSATPTALMVLHKQLTTLKNASRNAKEKCIQAGYSLSEIDEVLVSPVTANRTSPNPSWSAEAGYKYHSPSLGYAAVTNRENPPDSQIRVSSLLLDSAHSDKPQTPQRKSMMVNQDPIQISRPGKAPERHRGDEIYEENESYASILQDISRSRNSSSVESADFISCSE